MLALESILQLGNGAIIRETRILTSEASSPKCQVTLASHTDPVPASNSWGPHDAFSSPSHYSFIANTNASRTWKRTWKTGTQKIR